jgi:hypothetical protein
MAELVMSVSPLVLLRVSHKIRFPPPAQRMPMQINPQLPNNAIAACRSAATRRETNKNDPYCREPRDDCTPRRIMRPVDYGWRSIAFNIDHVWARQVQIAAADTHDSCARPRYPPDKVARRRIEIGDELAVSSETLLAAAPRSVAQPEPNEP